MRFHRVVYKCVETRNLINSIRYVPQWWFIWWHNYYEDIGYQYAIPVSFDTEDEAMQYLGIEPSKRITDKSTETFDELCVHYERLRLTYEIELPTIEMISSDPIVYASYHIHETADPWLTVCYPEFKNADILINKIAMHFIS